MRKERSAAQAAKKSIDLITKGELDFPALCELHATATTLARCGFVLELGAIEAVRNHAEVAFNALAIPQVDIPPCDDVVSEGFITADLPFVRAVLTFDAFYLAMSAAAGVWAQRYRSGFDKRVPRSSVATPKVDEPLEKSVAMQNKTCGAPEPQPLKAPVAHHAQTNVYPSQTSPKIVIPKSTRLRGHVRPSFFVKEVEPKTVVDDDEN